MFIFVKPYERRLAWDVVKVLPVTLKALLTPKYDMSGDLVQDTFVYVVILCLEFWFDLVYQGLLDFCDVRVVLMVLVSGVDELCSGVLLQRWLVHVWSFISALGLRPEVIKLVLPEVCNQSALMFAERDLRHELRETLHGQNLSQVKLIYELFSCNFVAFHSLLPPQVPLLLFTEASTKE